MSHPQAPKYDYERLINVGMPFVYEVGKKGLLSKLPRWDYNGSSGGWYDKGKTGILCEAEVLAIQDGTVIFIMPETRNVSLIGSYSQEYVIPLNNQNQVRGKFFHPYQWEWDGFFQPDGGWEQYLPVSQRKECGCGAEGLARITGQPVTGHGVMCQKWEPNPYQR